VHGPACTVWANRSNAALAKVVSGDKVESALVAGARAAAAIAPRTGDPNKLKMRCAMKT
jgi:hypothetical protein